jgi:amino acid transporter
MSSPASAPAQPASEPTLRRVIGPKLLSFFVIGDILGTGIYALTGTVAGEVGGAAWLSFGLSFIIAMFTATSYVELVGKYPKAAGAALYTQRAFGIHFLTFMVAFAVMCSGLTSAGAASRAFSGDYLEEAFWPGAPTLVVSIGFLVVLALVNFRGVSESVRLNVVLTCVELFGLLLIIVIGALALGRGIGDAGNAVQFNTGDTAFGLVVSGAALAFFALVGFEDSVNMAEETTDPTRTFPRALFVGITITGIIYMLVAFVATALVPLDRLAGSDGPLLEVIRVGASGFPLWLFSLIALFAVPFTRSVVRRGWRSSSRLSWRSGSRAGPAFQILVVRQRSCFCASSRWSMPRCSYYAGTGSTMSTTRRRQRCRCSASSPAPTWPRHGPGETHTSTRLPASFW